MLTNSMAVLQLKKGREKSVIRRHPWIFSGAVDRIKGSPNPGDTIEVHSSTGNFLGKAAYSPHSQIVARIWTFDRAETIDYSFFYRMLKQAIEVRRNIVDNSQVNAFRLVNAESDGLPGVVIDKYSDYCICQFSSCGAETQRSHIIDALQKLTQCKGIYERSDLAVRKKEGLEPRSTLLWGELPPELIKIQERDATFLIDCYKGHKTGFYLDQRENRLYVQSICKSKKILNCFSYTGAFCVAALTGGALHVTNIDSSKPVLHILDQHVQANNFSPSHYTNIHGDAFEVMRTLFEQNERFDVIICDPPKFAESERTLLSACRGYKDINMLAMKLIKTNGILVTFSCSGLLKQDLFQKIIADAALDTQRRALILHHLFQAPDHTISLNFPESFYLKGLVCQIC